MENNQISLRLSKEEFSHQFINSQLQQRGIQKQSDEFVEQQQLIEKRLDFLSMMPQGGVVAEIGVHKGFFTNCILQQNQPDKLHLIDPWFLMGKEWKWGKGNLSTVDALMGILDYYRKELVDRKLILHLGWSEEVLAEFEDGYFDWVYLDSSHEYEDTLKELNILKLKVKANGIIAGDDFDFVTLEKAVKEFMEKEDYIFIYKNMTDGQWAIQKRN
ncbi:MAG: class I SAM-dependent methyltransferase [Cyanobacteriota bacterium]|nr:class I SAM-dependent methyltransferase [Cyanobacteriota bacterium]